MSGKTQEQLCIIEVSLLDFNRLSIICDLVIVFCYFHKPMVKSIFNFN